MSNVTYLTPPNGAPLVIDGVGNSVRFPLPNPNAPLPRRRFDWVLVAVAAACLCMSALTGIGGITVITWIAN
jgi:hypothetical protein